MAHAPKTDDPTAVGAAALERAARSLAGAESLTEALAAIADAAADATAADAVVVRTADPGALDVTAQAVAATSPAIAAELEVSRIPIDDVAADEVDDAEALPAVVQRAAERLGATAVLQIPIRGRTRELLGTIELLRVGAPFSAGERALARLAASHVAVAVRAFGAELRGRARWPDDVLELAGDALAAGSDERRAADQVARLAADATGAVYCLVWQTGAEDTPVLIASHGFADLVPDLAASRDVALDVLRTGKAISVDDTLPGLPAGAEVAATIRLGQPPLGALQLFFHARAAPADADLARLRTFGVRAAHVLRTSERARSTLMELERTRALLAVVGQAIAQLSLTHTLETAVDNVAELLGAERVAVYLRDQSRLTTAAERALAGPHVSVAEALLELALGPFRTRGLLFIDDVAADERMARVAEAAAEAGIEAAVALPLLAQEEVAGLLVVYPPRGRALTDNEAALLAALATQLAVVVQNARLHEEVERRGAALERALTAEQQAARQLRALYEISRSFAQSLSLETTLDAVARTVVELLEIDAAVIRMPDARREFLTTRAVHVADTRLDVAARAILCRPQPIEQLPGRPLFRMGRPLVLDAASAASFGPPYDVLVPFFEKGSSAAVVPVATPTEVMATLTIISLDAERSITDETLAAASSIVGQAALAIDNARLYQQQKDFADTMQRSLLPRGRPQLSGIEVGHAYASSSRVDVGGDIYDFLPLADGRLAVVLGDVTGHGIEATADMAMAKFVFRSLAREHPEPSAFLAAANEVVVGEFAPGRFLTMVYLVVDAASGELALASAGHPAARIVGSDGAVAPLAAQGLALGVETSQEYAETRAALEPGAAVVLYTDGVIEARRGREFYGDERLDALLARRAGLDADALALAVLADCRRFAGGELADDCAIVVVERTAA